MEVKIALFQKKEIRKTIQENEWWFVITDVIAALTDSVNPAGYFKDMRRRDAGLAEALKGGGNLPPPLASNSTLLAGGNLEKKSGRKVVTKDNFLGLTQSAKKAVNLKGK